MTIATQMSKASFTGNGVTTSFPLPFPFLREADIKAVLNRNGADTELVLGTHYTLSDAGASSGGALLALTPPATGETLVVWRAPAIVQEVDYVENSAFPAQTHEAALDLLTMICQSLQEQIDRTVSYPVSTPLEDVLAPASFLTTAAASRDDARAASLAAAASAGQSAQNASAASAAAARAEAGANAAETLAALADGLIKVSATDTAGGSLSAKLVAGEGLAETLLAPGADESLRLAVALADSPGLEFAAGRLRISAGYALARTAEGLAVDPIALFNTSTLRPVISAARIINHALNGGF